MRQRTGSRKVWLLSALVAVGPLVAGCSGASMSDVFSSDLLSKDAKWFSRHGRTFIKNVSIETPPLTPKKPITPADLVSADGMCPGMAPPGEPADANAAVETPPEAPQTAGHVALGHTECDVVRGAGRPTNVSLSTGAGGERVAVMTYATGLRAGIYTFHGGRLRSIERLPEPAVQPRRTRARSGRHS